MREPQVTRLTPVGGVPLGILLGDVVGDKGFVFDDQRNLVRRYRTAGDQRGFSRIGYQIARFQTGIGVQARQARGAVLIKHETRTHVVGEIERGRTRARVGHVGNVLGTHTFTQTGCIGRRLACRRHPLMRRASTDPGCLPAHQTDAGTVLGVGGDAIRPKSGSGDRRIHRKEQRATYRQVISELHPHRRAFGRTDDRA